MSTLHGSVSDVLHDTNNNTVTTDDTPDSSDDIHEPTNSINTNGKRTLEIIAINHHLFLIVDH